MRSQRTLRHAVISALLLVAFLSQGTWALAGVTGNISGTVKDPNGAPIAGVQVQAVAPSGTRTATTDAGGHFVMLSLAPDTYTVTLTKEGYQGISFPGVTIFADQTQTVAYTMSRALRTIAHVTSSSGASLVKSGIGGDLYSVNSAQASAAQALGGGGNLNSAYSAMASVPGIQTSQGGLGWTFNAAYVRGQDYYYTAYEYDGIPVNRAFDNYNASTESSLGLQELQVYTGGGPASVSSAGTSGFINQVIKTGTFPGFATANLGIGTPAYYHQASVEVGGSTPDRTFSWYVGLLGFNQNYRFFDSTNGAGYQVPGGIFSGNTDGAGIGYGANTQVYNVGYMCVFATCQGVKPICPLVSAKTFSFPDQGCWQYYSGTSDNPFMITDRENVVNLHMGIPKSNGLRDDVQFLWSGSAVNNTFYQSQNDYGPGLNQFIYSLYGTHYAAPTCGPTTVAFGPGGTPGLTVNGCSGIGQVASFLQPQQYFLSRYYGTGPYICPTVALACGNTYLPYSDGVAYDLPFGAPVYSQKNGYRAPQVYMMPDTPTHDFNGPLPINDNSINSYQNNTGITKLQYTYALSQSAYLRAYGYTFYSDWLQLSPTFAASGEQVPSTPAGQYDLMTHTSGGALSFQDQINDQNLVSLDGNYTTASVIRFNNSSVFSNNSPIGYMAKTGNGFTCYGNQGNNPTAAFGYSVPCLNSTYYQIETTTASCPPGVPAPCAILTHPTWTSSARTGPQAGFGAPGTPAARAGATWDSLWQGNATGSLNTVKPKFTNASLSDQFRPSDKWLINAALRYDNFTYDLPNTAGAAGAFYANMTANYTCVLASTNQVMTAPPAPGAVPPPPTIYVNGDCNDAAKALFKTGPKTGWVHPNGTVQDGVTAPNFSITSPSSYSLDYWQPRFSATYTASPDTVFRASAGRFTQPPISASVQYLSASGDDRSVWNNTMNLGFYTPFHPIPGISSSQYDLSWEQHLRGTDMSFKLTPYFTWVSDWQQQTFIGAGFVTQVPVGVNRNYGVEFQFNKGDFTKNGLSGLFAFTYTNSKVMFQNVPLSTGGTITNELVPLNQVIAQYNALTKAGGGSPCYQGLTGVPCSTKNGTAQDTILNPYYNKPEQPLLDLGGWYNPFVTAVAPNLNAGLASYISPEVASLILNWRHDKLAITPSFSFQTGGFYGSPLDINGYDPRACVQNSAATGITGLSPHTNPLQCDIRTVVSPGFGPQGFLYIPNPQNGQFGFDNYQSPSSLVGNLQVTYDVSPKIRLSMLGANLFHTCFWGANQPWTAAYPPSNNICGYTPAGGFFNTSLYPSNWYLGTGINDFAANKARTPAAFQQSYTPSGVNNGAIGAAVLPINLYFNATVKI